MKTNVALIAFCIFLVFLAGCIPSIHPLYHEEDIVFKPELLGSWQQDDAKWVFEQSGEDGYLLKFYEDNNLINENQTYSDFDVTLVKLGGNFYLDIYPGENEQIEFSTLLLSTLLPVHAFAKIDFLEEGIEIKFLNRDWLEELLKENPMIIAHEKTPDYLVLTASTDELQEFIMKYSNVEEAFVESSLLKRITG
ncbi:MAG: hypothetical protein IH598_05980 [Bacteroidales bacterium]|nr:hypothetical protein [Bacteroidales bacterium]